MARNTRRCTGKMTQKDLKRVTVFSDRFKVIYSALPSAFEWPAFARHTKVEKTANSR